jgi:hypothetical protein
MHSATIPHKYKKSKRKKENRKSLRRVTMKCTFSEMQQHAVSRCLLAFQRNISELLLDYTATPSYITEDSNLHSLLNTTPSWQIILEK